MTTDETPKQLPLMHIINASVEYFARNINVMLLFSLINYITLVLGVYSWQKLVFWPLLAAIYVFWSFFFRYYFNRKPYLLLKPMLGSMVPSSKILVLSVVFVTLLVVLPLAPLFMGLPAEYLDAYQSFLQKYMQDSDVMDLGLNIIVILASPVIFYRPFFAWISALIGRSGSLKTALSKTRHNYFQFLVLGMVINFSLVIIQQLGSLFAAPVALILAFMAPLVVLFNIMIAKSYEFFFIDID